MKNLLSNYHPNLVILIKEDTLFEKINFYQLICYLLCITFIMKEERMRELTLLGYMKCLINIETCRLTDV